MAPPAVNIHAESGTFAPTQSHLGPSNFTFAHDPAIIKPSMCSIFKKDYPSHPHYGRCVQAKPPKLGGVMHQDDRYFNEKASETTKSFEYRYLKKPVLLNVHSKLSATNFKMDRDTNKFKCFDTTHDTYFTPQMCETYKRAHPILDTAISHIPQGDMEKCDPPVSDYRDRFQGHDTRKHKIEKAPTMHEGGPPTIKGDTRLSNFDTSTGDQFPGKWQPKLKPFPAPTGTSVPDGDTGKIVMRETTTGVSFPYRGDAVNFQPYRENISEKVYQTNFKQRDGLGTWDHYISTTTDCFKPKMSKFVRFTPKQHRNHSDFPEGDGQSSRLTTNNFYHGNPPRGLHNKIVSGADLRTRSSVSFGDPALGERYYSTSTDDVFTPKSVPYTYDRSKSYIPSAVPIQYYSTWTSEPTTVSDYKDPKQGKTIPQEDALDNLRRSHIFPPLKDSMFFNTTHRDLFTPKTSEKYTYDAGRLQQSSVPLGTLRMSTTV